MIGLLPQSTAPVNVSGKDNRKPFYQPDRSWVTMARKDLWEGELGENKWVANLHDHVIDPVNYITWLVIAVDPLTLIPTLRVITPGRESTIAEDNFIFAPSPGSMVAFFNEKTFPYSLNIDSQVEVNGSMSKYVRIFLGSDISKDTGKVISKIYDSSGKFVSDKVPLELKAEKLGERYHAVKIILPCKTTDNLQEGELLTIVAYNDQEIMQTWQQVKVARGSFFGDQNTSEKWIERISLKTPFMSGSDDRTIEFPLYVQMQTLNLMGMVEYSNGETLELPVNGDKFTLDGLDSVVASIPGHALPIILRYRLSEGEKSLVPSSFYNVDYIAEEFRFVVVDKYSSYAVKLFGYPYWVNTTIGWSMKWYMFNIDKDIYYDVSDKVRFDPITGPLSPKLYGVMQRKQVTVNLKDVNPAYRNILHTQTVDITLYGPAGTSSTMWTINNEVKPNATHYGLDLTALRSRPNTLNLASGIEDKDEWLQRVYVESGPLIDPRTGSVPSAPTHMDVVYKGETVRVLISDWDKDILFASRVDVNTEVLIVFLRDTGTSMLYLSPALMTVRT